MRRTAVIDLGSNSFRLVVYGWEPQGPWALTDEIREAVRISEGMSGDGLLHPEPVERAIHTVEVFAAFCRATETREVIAVGTSALREAANGAEVVAEIKRRSGLDVRVLGVEEEARYGALAIVNSTTLDDGIGLDIGGGSVQLAAIADRRMTEAASFPLGAVRVSEAFLPDERPSEKQVEALREHVREQLRPVDWLPGRQGGRIVGIGGSIRNLASAAQRRGGFPELGVQGSSLRREDLSELTEELATLPVSKRAGVPGIKPDRADVILGAAIVLEEILDHGGFGEIEATEAGLREGLFFERLLEDHDPPLLEDVRRRSVENLTARYSGMPAQRAHVEHVAHLSVALFDQLGAAGLHRLGGAERELLWAACELHDVGMAIDYEDHHKHSRYLILGSGLPGYSQRELAIIAEVARYHRKGTPGAEPLGALARKRDAHRISLLAGIVRIAEQLERARDQSVGSLTASAGDGRVRIAVQAGGDPAVPIWSAQRKSDLLAKTLGVEVAIERAPA